MPITTPPIRTRIRRITPRSILGTLIIGCLISLSPLLLNGKLVTTPSRIQAASSASTITVSQGTSRTLSADFLGFNGDSSSAAWANPSLLPAISALAPETIRGIDGGTPSNYFNWQTGQAFIAATDPGISYIKPGYPTPAYTLTNYVNALKAGNADGIFNVNVMSYCPVSNSDPVSTSQAAASCTRAQACGPNPSNYSTSCTNTDETWGLDYQIAMLQAAKSMGVPIKYIELGNELYISSNPDYAYYFPSVQAYINKVNAWIPILKQDFPGAQVAVVGEGSCQPLSAAGIDWNQAISSGVHGEAGITFHTYYANDIVDGSSVDNASDLAKLLSTSTQNCAGVLQGITHTYLPSGVTAWITEWNLWSGGTGIVLGSWTQGLTEAGYALDLARNPQVELTVKHDLVSNQVYGSLFASTNGYGTTAEAGKSIGAPAPLPTTQAFGMTAGGFALSALERSLHGATSTTALDFSANPDIADTSVSGLMGQSFTVNGKTNLYFVNLSADSENLNLDQLSGSYSVLQYASSPTNFVTGNSSIPASSYTVTNTLNVPAYSVTSLQANPSQVQANPTQASPPAPGNIGNAVTPKDPGSANEAATANGAVQGDTFAVGVANTTPTAKTAQLQSGNSSSKALLAVLAGAILICTMPMAVILRRRRRHA